MTRRTPSASRIAKTIAPQQHPRLSLRDQYPDMTVTSAKDARKSGHIFNDGFTNVANSMGVLGKDSTASTRFVTPYPLSYAELQGIHRFDGIGRRIVEIPTREMTRLPFEVGGDVDGECVKYLKKRGFLKQMTMLVRWAKLYGGAIGVILVDDGENDLSKPLNPTKVKNLLGMNVFDRWRVTFTTSDMQTDPRKPGYMWPTRYWVSPIGIAQPFYVHASRVIRMDGAPINELDRQSNNYWMDSVIQAPYDALCRMMHAYGMTGAILTDFVQAVFAMSNLSNLMEQGNEDLVIKRMQTMRLFKSNINALPIDKDGETYEKVVSTASGLSDVLDQYWALLSSTTGYPQSVWNGRSPSGLNASGDTERENFNSTISEEQQDMLAPAWEKVVGLVYACIEGPLKGKVDEDFKITFPPLSQASPKELAEIEDTQSKTDDRRIKNKTISSAEARTRLGKGADKIELGTVFKAPDKYDPPPAPEDEDDGDEPNGEGSGKKKPKKETTAV